MDDNTVIFQRETFQVYIKTRIAQSIPEAIARLHAKRIKETITDIDPFIVFLIIFVLTKIGIGGVGRQVCEVIRPAGCQSTGKILLS